MMMKHKTLFLLLSLLASISLYAQQLAFPGAEGFGRFATGGRGGTVYHVTNLNDDGPGSFRDAVSQPNRTVVFDVGGIIEIGDRIVVSNNVTIAGQTAPGEGIVIYGNGLSHSNANNSITRYIRVRMGVGGESGKDAMAIAEGSNMMFDHISVSWGRDGTFDINGNGNPISNITIQNSIISQGLVSHSTGGLMQTSGGVSLLRNLWIDNHTRNPKVKGVNQFVNNIIYNWNVAAYILGDSEGDSYTTVTDNYFIYGPNTGANPFTRGNENFHIFAYNNFKDNNKNGVLDGSVITEQEYGVVDWQISPYHYPSVINLSPQEAYDLIVDEVGSSFPTRDEVDIRLIQELTSLGTLGQHISEEFEGAMNGPGTVASGTAPTDTDGDGMPDDWENANSLNPNVADNNGDANTNGYTNLEDYLNSLVPIDLSESPDTELPAAPSNLKATSFSGNQIDLLWDDKASNEDGFVIQYSADGWTTSDEVTVALANMRIYSLMELSGSTIYQIRVAAYNTLGNSDFSNVASDSTIADKHYFLNTSVDGSGSISLDPPGGIYLEGSEVQVTAIPGSGYIFDSWTKHLEGIINPQTVTLNTSVLVSAKFIEKIITTAPLLYDFGQGSVEPGYTQITTSSSPYTYGIGFGFSSNDNLQQRDRGDPDNLRRDFCFSNFAKTFNIDLPNGEYGVHVIAGDNVSNAPNGPMDVYAEGIKKIEGMSSAGGEFSEQDFTIDIFDGQLNLKMVHVDGDDHPWRINALVLTAINVDPINNITDAGIPKFELALNYPNPFSASTTIKYKLKHQSEVELYIYNAMGQEIEILVNEQQTAGVHTVIFNAVNLDDGIYIYRLKVNSFEQRGKMILMK